MSEENSFVGPRWLAFTMAAIAAVTLVVAVISTPLGEWGTFNYLIGAVLIVFVVTFAISGIRGSFNALGRSSGKTSLIISVIGVVASVLGILSGLFGGAGTVDGILTTGTWAALLVMFLGSATIARKKMAAGQ